MNIKKIIKYLFKKKRTVKRTGSPVFSKSIHNRLLVYLDNIEKIYDKLSYRKEKNIITINGMVMTEYVIDSFKLAYNYRHDKIVFSAWDAKNSTYTVLYSDFTGIPHKVTPALIRIQMSYFEQYIAYMASRI